MSKDKATVKAKYVRISPKKVHPIVKEFRGLTLAEGELRCQRINNKTSKVIAKLIGAARSAAIDKDFDEDSVIIDSLVCQTGPTMKRQQIRSRGRADVIKKRSSHFSLTIAEKKKPSKNKKKSNKNKQKKKQ